MMVQWQAFMEKRIKFRILQSDYKFMAGSTTVGFSSATLLRDVR